jgi:hypothetical protein
MPERRPEPSRRAPLCAHDHGVDRSELTLFLLLVGAVGLAFANHARGLTRFVDHWPEFATLVADLFRVIV